MNCSQPTTVVGMAAKLGPQQPGPQGFFISNIIYILLTLTKPSYGSPIAGLKKRRGEATVPWSRGWLFLHFLFLLLFYLQPMIWTNRDKADPTGLGLEKFYFFSIIFGRNACMWIRANSSGHGIKEPRRVARRVDVFK